MALPKLVHSSWFVVRRKLKTINYEPLTINCCRKQPGFSYVELLIAVSILAIIFAASFVYYKNARAQARDHIRKNDLAQMKLAMELAKSLCKDNAYYPSILGGGEQADYISLGNYLSNPAIKIINSFSNDPLYPTKRYWFSGEPDGVRTPNVCPREDGTGYTRYGTKVYSLYILLENKNDPDSLPSRQKCAGKPKASSFTVDWPDSLNNGWYVVCDE